MIYRLPTLNDEKVLAEYVKEHRDNGEPGISACHGLQGMDYSEWVSMVQKRAVEGTDEWGKYEVLLCFDEDELIGLLSVRYDLSKELSEECGDIGYGVRPSKRNKGYATLMMKHALEVCKEQGLKEVRVGCYKDNIASGKVIVKCGGILTEESDKYSEGRISSYYSIVL